MREGASPTTFCAVRSTDFAYVAYGTGEEELYDINADPYELQNLAYDPGHAQDVQTMRAKLAGLCSPPPPGGYQPPSSPMTAITDGPHNPTASGAATFDFSAAEPGAGFHCSMDGSSFSACSSPKSYTGLSKGLHTFAVRATVHGGAHGNTAQWVWRAQGGGASVDVTDNAYVPKVLFASRGARVSWDFVGPSDHTVTDASGMGLFDSGRRAPGTAFSYIPPGAGNYAYTDTSDPALIAKMAQAKDQGRGERPVKLGSVAKLRSRGPAIPSRCTRSRSRCVRPAPRGSRIGSTRRAMAAASSTRACRSGRVAASTGSACATSRRRTGRHRGTPASTRSWFPDATRPRIGCRGRHDYPPSELTPIPGPPTVEHPRNTRVTHTEDEA